MEILVLDFETNPIKNVSMLQAVYFSASDKKQWEEIACNIPFKKWWSVYKTSLLFILNLSDDGVTAL